MISAIALGILLGLISGLLPGIGNTLIIMIMFPVVLGWPPEVAIVFYAVMIQCSSFSGSVSALNLGLLGDVTSDPALKERPYIVSNNLSLPALKYTALSSAISCVITLFVFIFLMNWFEKNPLFLRTEVKFLLVYCIIVSCLWWPKNGAIKNLLLLLVGVLMTLVGHHENFLGYQDFHFLTFRIPELYSGIPTIAVLTAFLAVPSLIKLHKNLSNYRTNNIENKNYSTPVKYSYSSNARGTIVGSVLGIVPMIGAMISSNVSWAIEKLFQKNKSEQQKSINRLIAAESANNSANITVLIPLLIFGLAIVPSEIVLLSIIETNAWRPNQASFELLGLGLYHWMFIGLIVACSISYLFCYSFVVPVSKFLNKNIIMLSIVTITVIIFSVAYSGWLASNTIIFLLFFALFSIIILLLKKIEFMPLVVGYMLGDEVVNSTFVIYNLYF